MLTKDEKYFYVMPELIMKQYIMGLVFPFEPAKDETIRSTLGDYYQFIISQDNAGLRYASGSSCGVTKQLLICCRKCLVAYGRVNNHYICGFSQFSKTHQIMNSSQPTPTKSFPCINCSSNE
jgi:hypothetical protein